MGKEATNLQNQPGAVWVFWPGPAGLINFNFIERKKCL
jgi:hypothetical protein